MTNSLKGAKNTMQSSLKLVNIFVTVFPRDLTLRVTSELRYWLTATAAQGDKVSEKLLTHLLRNNVTYILR